MSVSNLSSSSRPGVCLSTTRPAVPYEGQMIYETDTDMVVIWNGTAWRYLAATTATSGTVLQVVSATKTDAQVITPSALVYGDVTGLSVSITPKSTSSKIFVMSSISGMSGVGVNDGFIRIARDSTGLSIGDAAGSRTRAGTTFNKLAGGSVFNAPLFFLDSPSSTSALTYKIQITAGGGSLYVNRTETDSDASSYPRTTSSITVMEIAG